jgi:general secretion pathway protein K
MPLISVLWGLAVLTAISLSLVWNGSMSYGLARNGAEIASHQATIEAAVNRAVVALLDPQPDRRWRTDGVPQSFAFGGIPMQVSIQDELGKIDLNHAEGPVFVALLQSAGLDRETAVRLADKILDWRSATMLKNLNGAKAPEYDARGLTVRPRNGPFQSVNELLLVMDMTPALFRRIEPALTVYAGHQFVDPKFAPREVLLAQPNATPEQVDSTLAARSSAAAAVAGGTSLGGRAFTIHVQLQASARTVVGEAGVRLTDNPTQPYWLLNWRMR